MDVRIWQPQQLATNTHNDLVQGAFVPHMRRWINDGIWKGLSYAERSYSRSVVAQGQWVNDRKYYAFP
eukprot:579910-Pyramimonas_sp.AAC.1